MSITTITSLTTTDKINGPPIIHLQFKNTPTFSDYLSMKYREFKW